MFFTVAIALIAFFVVAVGTPILIRAARARGIVGRDVHKKNMPYVAELGGLAIAAGVVAAILFALAVNSFATLRHMFDVEQDGFVIPLLTALSVILMIIIIGFVDDVLGVKQRTKLILPILAALPLVALKITALDPFVIPFIGPLPIPPLVYVIILIPIGITAATNLTNTFAGFNGMEAGMGAVIAAVLLALGWHLGLPMVMMLSAAMLGALSAFLLFNWYPAKIFPDDVGTLLIGCMIGIIIILGRIEVAGMLLLLPHIIDFVFFKIPNSLPQEVAQPWTSVLKEGNKLYPPRKSVTLAQAFMRAFGGLTEKNLVLLLIGIEIVLGLIVLAIYW
ncbi:MAG: hypothetical protein QW112_00765 [Candidatus Micrarchaeia archaeon]